MKRTKYLSKKERLEGYTTVANFLMSGDSKEVKEFAERLDWQAFTIHTYEFMSIDFIRKYKDYIDWGYICCTQTLSNEIKREMKNDKIKIKIYRAKANDNFVLVEYTNMTNVQEKIKEMYEYSKNDSNETLFGIQVVLPNEKLISDVIQAPDVYKIDLEDFKLLSEDNEYLCKILNILINMCKRGRQNFIQYISI